jgi:hypothetical protein
LEHVVIVVLNETHGARDAAGVLWRVAIIFVAASNASLSDLRHLLDQRAPLQSCVGPGLEQGDVERIANGCAIVVKCRIIAEHAGAEHVVQHL